MFVVQHVMQVYTVNIWTGVRFRGRVVNNIRVLGVHLLPNQSSELAPMVVLNLHIYLA